MKEDILNERVQSYQNIYNILTENVAKAKERHSHLGQDINQKNKVKEDISTDDKILKQRREFENLLKQYYFDAKNKDTKK